MPHRAIDENHKQFRQYDLIHTNLRIKSTHTWLLALVFPPNILIPSFKLRFINFAKVFLCLNHSIHSIHSIYSIHCNQFYKFSSFLFLFFSLLFFLSFHFFSSFNRFPNPPFPSLYHCVLLTLL